MPGREAHLFRRFQQEAHGTGVPLTDGQVEQFRIYLDELRQWNRTVRLVSEDSPESVVWRHFMDSLLVLPFLPRQGALADIGSGAGFPGLPLKIGLPTLTLHLVESQRRKASFLRQVIRRLGLADAVVHHCRIEEFPKGALFRVAISRAVARPQTWVRWAVDRLEEQGEVVLMLGPTGDRETLLPDLEEMGLRLRVQADRYLPVLHHRRRIVVLIKGRCFT